MTKERYESFEEWLKDFSVYEKNPSDRHFVIALERRTHNSSNELKDEIQEFLQNRTLETNPFEVFSRVMRALGPGYILIVKSTQDPWFGV